VEPIILPHAQEKLNDDEEVLSFGNHPARQALKMLTDDGGDHGDDDSDEPILMDNSAFFQK
jgi:hypothetical protein